MQYFNVDDIIEHVLPQFPELTPKSLKQVVKHSLTTIGQHAKRGRSLDLTVVSRRHHAELGYYFLFMPGPMKNMINKLYKTQERERRKREKY